MEIVKCFFKISIMLVITIMFFYFDTDTLIKIFSTISFIFIVFSKQCSNFLLKLLRRKEEPEKYSRYFTISGVGLIIICAFFV